MKKAIVLALLVGLILGCTSVKNPVLTPKDPDDFIVTFGSCNKHDVRNELWDDVLKVSPDVWIWGGDIIYADTDDMSVMRSMYNAQDQVRGYNKLKKRFPSLVLGTITIMGLMMEVLNLRQRVIAKNNCWIF